MSPITSNIFHEISWSIWFESVVQQCGHCFTLLLDMFDLDSCTFFTFLLCGIAMQTLEMLSDMITELMEIRLIQYTPYKCLHLKPSQCPCRYARGNRHAIYHLWNLLSVAFVSSVSTFSFIKRIDFHCCWMILNIYRSVSWILSVFFLKGQCFQLDILFLPIFFFLLYFDSCSVQFARCICYILI